MNSKVNRVNQVLLRGARGSLIGPLAEAEKGPGCLSFCSFGLLTFYPFVQRFPWDWFTSFSF